MNRSDPRAIAASKTAAAKRKCRKESLKSAQRMKEKNVSRHERDAAKKRAWHRRMAAKSAANVRRESRHKFSHPYKYVRKAVRRIVISFPRSGRHWITTILHRMGYARKIEFTHDRSTYGSILSYESNQISYRSGFVALLARDPRDVTVSMWHFCKYRNLIEEFRYMSLWDYTKSVYGINYQIRFLNDWANSSNRHELVKFHIFRYEDMTSELVLTLEKLLDFFSYKSDDLEWTKLITPDVVQYRPGSTLPDDPRARHCRRAEVGAWRDYYTEDQSVWLTEKLRELNPVYGYR